MKTKNSKKSMKKKIAKASKSLLNSKVKWEDLLGMLVNGNELITGYYGYVTEIYNKVKEDNKLDNVKNAIYVGFVNSCSDMLSNLLDKVSIKHAKLDNNGKPILTEEGGYVYKKGVVSEKDIKQYISIFLEYEEHLGEIVKFATNTLMSTISKLDPNAEIVNDFDKLAKEFNSASKDLDEIKQLKDEFKELAAETEKLEEEISSDYAAIVGDKNGKQ